MSGTTRSTEDIEIPFEVYMQVVNVHNRYTFHLDAQEFELAADVYTEDATFDTIPTTEVPGHSLPARGRAKVVSLLDNLTQIAASRYSDSSKVKHIITNIFISEYAENILRSYAYVTVVRTARGAAPEIVQIGMYDDEMVRELDGQWRIANRKVYKDVSGFMTSTMND